MTVCTTSRAQKLLIAQYLDETSDTIEELPFKLHDFGYRGASSVEVMISPFVHIYYLWSRIKFGSLMAVLSKTYWICLSGMNMFFLVSMIVQFTDVIHLSLIFMMGSFQL